jgi:hypothetical protein
MLVSDAPDEDGRYHYPCLFCEKDLESWLGSSACLRGRRGMPKYSSKARKLLGKSKSGHKFLQLYTKTLMTRGATAASVPIVAATGRDV